MTNFEGSKKMWSKLEKAERDSWWSTFNSKFDFRPGSKGDPHPGIVEPTPSVTFNLDINMTTDDFRRHYDRLNSEVLLGFRSVFPKGVEMIALDWQHPGYKFFPFENGNPEDVEWVVPIYPNGDYYSFFLQDLSEGTFGHPWQRTICIFGPKLTSTLGVSLRSWLQPVRINGKPIHDEQ
ncbi:DUF2716 domain-containing protein [Rhodococcus opacus]|uniref:DUF2716 domain-containing protein n=1 Tax=Rhodococcus opacus TaxID=37919 RepID=UPI001F569941|nr:DUF2716 domain-containing protein [Rhodococcus opacus]UNN05307.1 DUF2716 domain-containing protein [Rhodococcus opacus]